IVLSKIWNGNIPGVDNTFMAISPDGRYLVAPSKNFTELLIHDLHDVSFDRDRYLRSTLSPSDGEFTFPRFTPDGKRVVYVSDLTLKGGWNYDLRTINIDGTDDRSVFKSNEYSGFELSAISPDGKLAAIGLVRADSARSD